MKDELYGLLPDECQDCGRPAQKGRVVCRACRQRRLAGIVLTKPDPLFPHVPVSKARLEGPK